MTLLETLPRSRELGLAYANLASLRQSGSFPEEALAHARRALELGEPLEDDESQIDALATIGSCDSASGGLDRASNGHDARDAPEGRRAALNCKGGDRR